MLLSMCMWVCECVYVCVFTSACVCVCAYINIYTCMYVYIICMSKFRGTVFDSGDIFSAEVAGTYVHKHYS